MHGFFKYSAECLNFQYYIKCVLTSQTLFTIQTSNGSGYRNPKRQRYFSYWSFSVSGWAICFKMAHPFCSFVLILTASKQSKLYELTACISLHYTPRCEQSKYILHAVLLWFADIFSFHIQIFSSRYTDRTLVSEIAEIRIL